MNRKPYKRTWMAAFRKMTGVHSNDSLQYNSGSESSDEELDCRMQNGYTFVANRDANESTNYNIQSRARSTTDESSEDFVHTDSHFSVMQFKFALKTGVWDIYLHGLKSMLGGVPHDFIRQEYKRVH